MFKKSITYYRGSNELFRRPIQSCFIQSYETSLIQIQQSLQNFPRKTLVNQTKEILALEIFQVVGLYEETDFEKSSLS